MTEIRNGQAPEPEPIEMKELFRHLEGAMGAVSVMEASHPNDVMEDEPDYRSACRAIYETLNGLWTQLNALDEALGLGDRVKPAFRGSETIFRTRTEAGRGEQDAPSIRTDS